MRSLRKAAPAPDRTAAGAFREMVRDRPETGRRQLIGGEALLTMDPPGGRRQRIASNRERLLKEALAERDPGRDAIGELGPRVEERPDFRPVDDLVVPPFDRGDRRYSSAVHLAAGRLPPSGTREPTGRKRQLCARSPFCLHAVIPRRDEFCCGVRSRSRERRGQVFRSGSDRIELPESGFACAPADLRRGAGVS